MNINKLKDLGNKISQLSFAKKFWLTFGFVIFIWQAVCFVQGAITARAMNYYCEKEAGIKLAKGTYFMRVSGEDYKNICLKNNAGVYPYYCNGNSTTKREWVKVKGSVKRPKGIIFFRTRQQIPATNPSNYIANDIGGLVKETTRYTDANGKLIYMEINFTVNAELMLADYYSFEIFKNNLPNMIDKGKSCNIPESDLKYRNSINGFLVNKG